MRHHRPLLIALLTAGVLAATACTSTLIPEPGPTTPPSPTADPTVDPEPRWGTESLSTDAAPAWVLETTPVGVAPAVIGNTLVAYVTEGGHPFTLLGIDLATGERTWSWDATVVDTVYGLNVTVVDDGIGGALIATTGMPEWDDDAGEWNNSIALLDPATGNVVAYLDDMWVSSFYDCGLPGGVCFWGYESGSDVEVHLGILRDGSVGEVNSVIDGYEYSGYAGNDLYVVRDAAGDDFLVRAERRVPHWAIPASALFRGDLDLMQGHTGWTPIPGEDIVVFQISPVTNETVFRTPAAQIQTGAVDTSTGEVLWTRDGAMHCWGTQPKLPAVLCRGDMGYERTADQEATTSYIDGDVTLMGIDVRTGDELWTRTVSGMSGHASGLAAEGYLPFGGFAIYSDASGMVALDTLTDQPYSLRAGDMVACTRSVSVTTPEWSVAGADPITLETGIVVQGCGASDATSDPRALTQAVVLGNAVKTWISRDAPIPAETDERMRVVQLENAIAGYRF